MLMRASSIRDLLNRALAWLENIALLLILCYYMHMSEFSLQSPTIEHPQGAQFDHFPGAIADGDPYSAHSVPPFDYWHGKPEDISGVGHWSNIMHPDRSAYVTGMVTDDGELVWGEGIRRHAVPIAEASSREAVATFQAIWDHDSSAPREISVVVLETNRTAADAFIQMLQRNIVHSEVQIKRTVIGPNHTVLSSSPSVPIHLFRLHSGAAEPPR